MKHNACRTVHRPRFYNAVKFNSNHRQPYPFLSKTITFVIPKDFFSCFLSVLPSGPPLDRRVDTVLVSDNIIFFWLWLDFTYVNSCAIWSWKSCSKGLPVWCFPVVKNPAANTGAVRDTGSTPGSGRSPGGGHSNLLQSSCLENPMDGRAWWATVHGVPERQMRLKGFSTHACILVNTFVRLNCCCMWVSFYKVCICLFGCTGVFVVARRILSCGMWDLGP